MLFGWFGFEPGQRNPGLFPPPQWDDESETLTASFCSNKRMYNSFYLMKFSYKGYGRGK